jgi:hypothetical protein
MTDTKVNAQIKGACIRSVFDFLDEHDKKEETLQALPVHYRDIFDQEILPALWYPMEPYLQLLDAINMGYSRKMPDAFFSMGSKIIFDGMNSIYRAFFRVGGTDWLIRRSNILWTMIFQGTTLEIAIEEPGVGIARVVGDVRTTRNLCKTIVGGLTEALLLTGAANVRITHPTCRAAGDEFCAFHATWNP